MPCDPVFRKVSAGCFIDQLHPPTTPTYLSISISEAAQTSTSNKQHSTAPRLASQRHSPVLLSGAAPAALHSDTHTVRAAAMSTTTGRIRSHSPAADPDPGSQLAPCPDYVDDRPPVDDSFDTTYVEKKAKPPMRLVWRNIILMGVLHLTAVYALTLVPSAKPLTWLWAALCFLLSALGVTAGAHRLWSHRTYTAATPLRVFLAIANSMAFQNHIYEWARDHRVHHKFSETDADPHNATRGFFFSHVGWLMVRKHPDVIEKGKKLDLADLRADPVVMFQKKYYKPSVVLLCFVLPTFVPWYFWGELFWTSYFLAAILRYTLVLNATWLVNSAAHMFGNKPYDITINPRENRFVAFGAIGEGFHNYHHTFPYDYSTSEYGWRGNITTCFIDLVCWLGLASNCKVASHEVIMARRRRTGDGSIRSG